MARPLNFRQIEAFRAVMQSGTTTAAAAMLHTTQPSVSRLLAQVQAASGLKLFDVNKGRLRPTPEAQQLFDTVQRHFLGLEGIEQSIAALRRSGVGHLRIGCTPALGVAVMPPVIAEFARRHPEVRISLQTIGTQPLREGLLRGLYDFAVTTSPLDDPHLQPQVLHRAGAVGVVQRQHALARRTQLDAQDLRGQVLITLNADDPITRHLQHVLRQRGVDAAATIETSYSATICMLALQGIGVGIVNPYVAAVHAPALAALPLVPACPIEVYFAHAPQTAPSAMAERFAALLRTHFDTLPPARGRAGRAA